MIKFAPYILLPCLLAFGSGCVTPEANHVDAGFVTSYSVQRQIFSDTITTIHTTKGSFSVFGIKSGLKDKRAYLIKYPSGTYIHVDGDEKESFVLGL
jgi:hypothetical protein